MIALFSRLTANLAATAASATSNAALAIPGFCSTESSKPREFRLQQRITDARLHRPNETAHDFWGMSAGASAAQLFLADNQNYVVRAFDVRSGQLDARDAYRCTSGESLHDVAYVAHKDTLFVATCAPSGVQAVRLLGRTGSEWREFHQLALEGYTPNTRSKLRALSDESLVFGVWRSAELRVLSADSSHALQTPAQIQFSAAHWGFDVQLAAGEIRLTAALRTPTDAVALFRIAGGRAEALSRYALQAPCQPLFVHDSLLVKGRTADADGKGWQVHALLGSRGGRLEPRGVLLGGRDNGDNSFPVWCVVNDALAAWLLEPATLALYSMH